MTLCGEPPSFASLNIKVFHFIMIIGFGGGGAAAALKATTLFMNAKGSGYTDVWAAVLP